MVTDLLSAATASQYGKGTEHVSHLHGHVDYTQAQLGALGLGLVFCVHVWSRHGQVEQYASKFRD